MSTIPWVVAGKLSRSFNVDADDMNVLSSSEHFPCQVTFFTYATLSQQPFEIAAIMIPLCR